MLTCEEGAHLVRAPKRWRELSDDHLESAVALAIMRFGLQDAQFSEKVITPFLDHAFDRLSVDRRLRIVIRIGEILERTGRDFGRVAGGSALLPVIHRDLDLQVVSTAALVLAENMAPESGDPLTGPRHVIGLAGLFDAERMGYILGGLAQMGDSRVCALVRQAWPTCSFEAQRTILSILTAAPPTVAAFEFVLDVLELQPADETHFGYAAAVLRRLSRKAAGDEPSPHSGRGFLDVERALPCWASESEGDVFRIKKRYTTAEFLPRVEARLLALVAQERDPKVLPHVLAELGVPFGPKQRKET